MEISYTSKAKNDLTQIHWKTRNSLIDRISQYKLKKNLKDPALKLMRDTHYYKLTFNEYVALGTMENDELNIIAVLEKRKIKVPN